MMSPRTAVAVSCVAAMVGWAGAAPTASAELPGALERATRASFSAVLSNGVDGVIEAGTDAVGGLLLNGVAWYFSDVELSVPGTGVSLTPGNYYNEMGRFLLDGMKADNGVAMQQWYLEGTGATEVGPGTTREGPGPATTTKMGFEDVRRTCEAMAGKIEAGVLERRNELGMQVLGPGAWPEAPGGLETIVLGQSRENHAFFRPILAAALDNGADGAATCDGSRCWNEAWLERKADEFIRSRGDGFDTSDTKWFVSQLLHKILLDIDLSEAAAREFASFMNSMLLLIPLPEEVMSHWLVEPVVNPSDTLATKQRYLAEYEGAIRRKYPVGEHAWAADATKVTLVASVFMDTLLFAGGLSVPTVMGYVLALTHMAESNKHASLQGVELGLDNYQWILWETLRKYAPVAGVPYWEHRTGGDGMDHVIPNVAQALMDASVFPEPLEFKNRGLPLYHAKMANTSGTNAGMGWAGPAIAPSKDTAHPHSHNCPAQDLSFRILTSFFKAFITAGPWSAVDSEGITVSAYRASGFSVLKRGLQYTTGCQYFPSCRSGYQRVSTKWCWWGRRDWKCRVV